MPFGCFGKKKKKTEEDTKKAPVAKPEEGETQPAKGASSNADKRGEKDTAGESKGRGATSPTDSEGKGATTTTEEKQEKPRSEMTSKELLAAAKNDSYLTFTHEDGTEYVTYYVDGQRYYVAEEEGAWKEFPEEWFDKGEFRDDDEPMFEIWTSPEGEEYTTTVKDDGSRVYVDFETGEWQPFPKEWEALGSFTPVEEEEEDDEAEEWGTIDHDGTTYTTVTVSESIRVMYYLDEELDEWVKVPSRWLKSDSRPSTAGGRPLTRQSSKRSLTRQGTLGNLPGGRDGDEEDAIELKAAMARQESEAEKALQKEVDNLRDKVRELEDQVFELKTASSSAASGGPGPRPPPPAKPGELDKVKKENAKLKSEVEKLRAEAETGSKQLSEKVKSLEAELEAARSKSTGDDTLKEALKEKDAKYDALEAKYNTLEQEQAKSRAAMGSTKEAINGTILSLKSELDAVRPVLADLQSQVVTFRKEQSPDFTKCLKMFGKFEKANASQFNELRSKLRKEQMQRKQLYNQLQELKGNIRVYARVRPTSKRELDLGVGSSVKVMEDEVHLDVNGAKKVFEFEQVYGEQSTQEEVFEDTQPLIASCIDGYNVCVFAYGQTGSGKTFTMMGTPEMRGVNLRALRELFRICKERDDYDYTITVGFIEIYNEQIRDLLDSDPDKKPEVRQGPNGNFIEPLHEEVVASEDDVVKVINRGHENRTVAATAMNSESSRSHSLILIRIEGVNKFTKGKSTGKLTLVDLAGSERQKKSEASGQRLTEAAAINKSLSALGNVIAALQAGQSHVPFRNSKLTHLLSDSLGGNAKVLMFLALSPSADNSEETLNSLQFGARVRNVTLGTATANNSDAKKGGGKGKGKGKKKLPPTKK